MPLIPQHTLYCEPFLGGGAIFFAKPQSPIEVLNDTNKELMNFYKVVQNEFGSLEKEIHSTLHSRSLHKDAQTIYSYPHLFSSVQRAWAVRTLAVESFGSILTGAWGYDKTKENCTTKKIMNKIRGFTKAYAARLQHTQIECADALYIIKSRDSDQAFFYCDPPYFNSDCKHYK